MELTRLQIVGLIIVIMLTLAVYAGLVFTVIQTNQRLERSRLPTPPPPEDAGSPTPTLTPSPTPSPTPTITPTPAAPQTRYDLDVQADPEDPQLRIDRGYAYIEREAYEYALADFDTAIELDPTLPNAYLGRGEGQFYLREWTAARDSFEEAVALDPELAAAHAWLGHLLSLRTEHEQAIEHLEEAVALDENEPAYHVWLADALLRADQPAEAETRYSTALGLESQSVEAYVGRALALAEQTVYESALQDLEAALDIAPYDPTALNGKAWFNARYLATDFGEARELAQRALTNAETELDQAKARRTLGWIAYQEGDVDAAQEQLQEAIELATIDGVLVYPEMEDDLEAVQDGL